MNLLDIYEDLKEDIHYIERQLHQSLNSENGLMQEAASHLLKAGGKRIRPVFVLLGGKTGTYDLDRLKYVAVALELVHMATLVHDDVIDDADIRRGQLTVKSKWDNRIAMYTGKYIFAQAIGCISSLEDIRIHQILSKAMIEIVIGEMEQIRALYDWNQSLRTYLLRIKRKTALLMAISCQMGALSCGAKEKYVQALYRYGYFVGMAFQITDDILDFTGTEQDLGKPAGSDLRQGNITLPALCALRKKNIRRAIVQEFEHHDPDMEKVIDLVITSGGVECAKGVARKYLDKAREALHCLENGYSNSMFFEIADFIEKRTF